MRLLLFLFTVLPFICFSQQNAPFKKCNTIKVSLQEDAKDVYQTTVIALMRAGFSIDQKDENLMFVSTEYCNCIKAAHAEIRINAFVEKIDSATQVTFKGDLFFPDFLKSSMKIEYWGMKKSPGKQSFEKMDEIAKSLSPNAIVTYYLD